MPTTHDDRDRGSIAWALLVSMALTALVTVLVASVLTGLHRSKASTDDTMLTQYTDVAVADAVARLNAGETLPAALATSSPKCERITNRFMCIRYWALPVPGSALDPVRYDLVSRAWVDDGDMLEPADGARVRQVKLPLEVLTYQTATGVTPELVGGDTAYIAYHPTPSGLFANAIHSFTSTTIEGPAVTVRSYNSVTGDTGTRAATVSSSGWLSFGAETQADQTVLYGGASVLGDHVSRCTGEVCSESGTRVVAATYAHPGDPDVQWMRDKASTCTAAVDGDWVASEHSGTLPAGTTCINGSLVIDTPTVTSSPLTTLYVNGTISVRASLNAPLAGQLANPAALVVFSTGQAVSFDAPLASGFAALMYAPLATCGNNPANPSTVTYFGSLVCGTVSLGGHWEHLYDDAAVAQFVDPVPGMKKTFSPGVPTAVDFDSFATPPGWSATSCPVPAPSSATGYWKLDEAGGILARDSSGNGGDAGWRSGASRTTGVCGNGASLSAGGAVLGTKQYVGTTGASLDYWAKATAGAAVQVGGITVSHDATSHVSVTVGGTTVTLPFTVQNHSSWHHYVITVDTAGTVKLYVDGVAKASAPSGVNPGTIKGAVTIASGTGGAIDEVAFYPKALTATEVAQRFTAWTSPSKIDPAITLTPAGTPFSAPSGVADNASTPTALKIRWATPAGTFPTTDPLTSYRVERSANGTAGWAQIGTSVAGTATSSSTANPPIGLGYYRVCAIYNGDSMCSAAVGITTLDVPATPVVSVGAITTTTAAFSWTTPTYTDTIEWQFRLDGGTWVGPGFAPDPAVHSYPVSQASVTLGPVTQGTRIEVRARAVNAAGRSPWSAVATANLSIQAILANTWTTTSSYPWLYSALVYTGGPMCPAGTIPQAKMRDQVTPTWGSTWNGYGGWASGVAGSNQGPWMGSYFASYDAGVSQLQTIRCYNPSSGNAGPEWGEHGPITMYHPIPAPTNPWAGVIAYRTAGWGATCTPGTVASYQWRVVGAFNTGPQGWTFATSWANAGQAWGSGAVYMTARCEAAGPRYSATTVSASGGFG